MIEKLLCLIDDGALAKQDIIKKIYDYKQRIWEAEEWETFLKDI